MISEIIGYIGQLAISLISFFGYFGIFILMVFESMFIPIPSELVMPFAGFLIAQGEFSFLGVVFFSTLGSLVGSLISYYLGKYGGNPLIVKYGKYVLLDIEDLKKTESWFQKKGSSTIFIGRFIPVVRHLISIPAGIGNMDLKKFCLYTVAGAGLWNLFLAWVGYILGQNWDTLKHYTEPLSIIVVIVLVGAIAVFVYKRIKDKNEAI